MHTFADRDDINDLQAAEVCFGGVALLKNRAERTRDQYTEDSGRYCKRQECKSCQRGFGQSKHRPAQSSGQQRGGGEVGSTARVNG